MSVHVLDASASVDLLLETPTGLALEAQLPPGARWWVPEHSFIKVTSALRRIEIQGAATSARVATAFARFTSAPTTRVQIRPLVGDAWARRGHLTIADAIYVVLAEHLNAPLVTTDRRLAASPGLTTATITA